MNRACTFVQGIAHEEFLRLMETFCTRKDVTHLMTYGINYIDESEKKSVTEAIEKVNFTAKSDTEVEDFCRAIHARAICEKG